MPALAVGWAHDLTPDQGDRGPRVDLKLLDGTVRKCRAVRIEYTLYK